MEFEVLNLVELMDYYGLSRLHVSNNEPAVVYIMDTSVTGYYTYNYVTIRPFLKAPPRTLGNMLPITFCANFDLVSNLLPEIEQPSISGTMLLIRSK